MDFQQEEQDVEFEAFLRQFRARTPPTFRAARLSRLVTMRRLAIAAVVLLACAIPVRFLWSQRASDDRPGAARESGSLPAPSAGRAIPGQGLTPVRQESSAFGRALNLIPSVETTLSAFALPVAPQDRVEVSLPAEPPRRVIARVKPAYPPEAQRLGLEAYVVLKLTVDAAGSVTGTERISGVVNLHSDEKNASERAEFYAANPFAFTVAAEGTAKQWRFEPSNSAMTCFVSFTFRLTPTADAHQDPLPRTGSAALSAVPGSSRPGLVVRGGPIRVDGRTIKPPVRLVAVNPVYPDDAKAAHVEGVVLLEITIGEGGSVTDARVLRSVPMLDQAAIDAVLQWIYEPTLLNGEPVEVEMTVTLNFTLR